jgi:hypothetical protein
MPGIVVLRPVPSRSGDADRVSEIVVTPPPLPGRLKPRLQNHEVRLRGLGGPAVCGVPRTGASATGAGRSAPAQVAAPGTRGHNPRRRISRFSSGEFIRSWRGLGGRGVCGVPRTGAAATGGSGRHPRVSRRADPAAPRPQSAKADFAIFQRRIHSLLVRTRRPGCVRRSRTGAAATGGSGRHPRVSRRADPAATVREGGLCDFPAANSFAPGADSAASFRSRPLPPHTIPVQPTPRPPSVPAYLVSAGRAGAFTS